MAKKPLGGDTVTVFLVKPLVGDTVTVFDANPATITMSHPAAIVFPCTFFVTRLIFFAWRYAEPMYAAQDNGN